MTVKTAVKLASFPDIDFHLPVLTHSPRTRNLRLARNQVTLPTFSARLGNSPESRASPPTSFLLPSLP